MENKELKIQQQKNNTTLICKLSGWLDPNTSPELIKQINLSGITSLIFDMAEVEYVFSYGIRALLMLQRNIENAGGTLKLINVPQQIRFVFEDTGLDKMLE